MSAGDMERRLTELMKNPISKSDIHFGLVVITRFPIYNTYGILSGGDL